MKKTVFIMMIAVIFAFLLCGCNRTSESDSKEGTVSIVATTFPGYDFARAVAGDNAEITMLLSPGEESHSFDPTPTDIIKIEKSDLFIYVGGESDAWVEEILDSFESEYLTVFPMMEKVSLYEEEEKEGMMEERGEEHESNVQEEETEYDEHIWTSPVNAIILVNGICDTLCEKDPKNADEYRKNAESYVSELEKLDSEFRSTVKNAKRKTLLFGDRFPFLYFVREYGLDYFAAFPGCSSETEPNAATIAFLIDKANEERIPVILMESMSNGNIANAIGEETGGKVLSLYACHNISAEDFENGETYLSLMRKNLLVLKEALN